MEWFNINERQPRDGEMCLVTFFDNDTAMVAVAAYIIPATGEPYFNLHYDKTITHWKPMPNPPDVYLNQDAITKAIAHLRRTRDAAIDVGYIIDIIDTYVRSGAIPKAEIDQDIVNSYEFWVQMTDPPKNAIATTITSQEIMGTDTEIQAAIAYIAGVIDAHKRSGGSVTPESKTDQDIVDFYKHWIGE